MDKALIKVVDIEAKRIIRRYGWCMFEGSNSSSDRGSDGYVTSTSSTEETLDYDSEKLYDGTNDLSQCDWNHIASNFTRHHKVDVTNDQCWQRWYNLNPSLNKLENRRKPWTIDYDERLLTVVEKHRSKGQRRGIAWREVTNAMQRPYVECRSRFRALALKAQTGKG